jgi:hypothetical protein
VLHPSHPARTRAKAACPCERAGELRALSRLSLRCGLSRVTHSSVRSNDSSASVLWLCKQASKQASKRRSRTAGLGVTGSAPPSSPPAPPALQPCNESGNENDGRGVGVRAFHCRGHQGPHSDDRMPRLWHRACHRRATRRADWRRASRGSGSYVWGDRDDERARARGERTAATVRSCVERVTRCSQCS